MRVRVYRNLRRGDFSVQDARTRRVIAHRTELSLTDARFVVSEAGRERVLRERRKNVHAFVVGELDDHINSSPSRRGCQVVYNPYKFQTFVDTLFRLPVHVAAHVHLDRGQIWVLK